MLYVIYDGQCGLCHRVVRFARAKKDLFRDAFLAEPQRHDPRQTRNGPAVYAAERQLHLERRARLYASRP